MNQIQNITILNPATGELVGTLPAAGQADAAAAVRSARKAFGDWQRVSPAERGSLLKSAADRVEAAAPDLAELTTREMGKPIGDALGGVIAGVSTLRQYAELGPVHRGKALQGGWDAIDIMLPGPRGIVAAFTPWNDPVAVSCGLIGAALAAGNTVIFKPSERAPHTGMLLAAALAGVLPDAVLQTVIGAASTGAAICEQADVDVLAHVGSTRAGRQIAQAAARTGAKVILENGGNDALLVDGGVNAEWAADQAALGAFANAGQICTSVERIYVHESIAAAVIDALVSRAKGLRQGNGLDPRTQLGPLVDARHRQGVHAQVLDAFERGAEVLCGGSIPPGLGAFYPATVIAGCSPGMNLMSEETFGPIAPIQIVESMDEAVAHANADAYGLAATVLTSDMETAQSAWRDLRVGTVKINAVFGGAPGGASHPRGASGAGFGFGPELLDELSATKVVHIQPAFASR